MRIRFEEVTYRRTVNTRCTACSKKLRRVVSESQTVNPFNKNPDGSVKTRAEVAQSVMAELRKAAEFLETYGTKCRDCA